MQYEGGASEGGRGPCVWDAVAHIPGMYKYPRSSCAFKASLFTLKLS